MIVDTFDKEEGMILQQACSLFSSLKAYIRCVEYGYLPLIRYVVICALYICYGDFFS